MKKIAFMCDSSADITPEQAKEFGFYVLRMPITVDGQEYIESETIFDEDIIKALREHKVVKTAQPIVGDMLKMWDTLLETYDEVFYLPLTYALSGTCKFAIQASESDMYRGKVTVVNSEYVAYPAAYQLQVAKDMAEKGYDTKVIKEKLEKESTLYAILIPETLDALKAGGRISSAAAALAGLLKIHPLLKIEKGAIDLYDKVRTIKKAYAKGIDAVTKGIDPSEYTWMVIDAYNREMSNELKALLEEATGQPVQQHTFKAVILSHTGQGTIGFGRIKKIKY